MGSPEERSEDRRFYWDWLKHEENLVTNRSNFFLVAQAMLLAAMASLYTSNSAHTRYPIVTLCLAGILITCVWLYVNAKHLLLTGKQIRGHINSLDPRVQALRTYRGIWRLRSHNLIGYMIPTIILVVWGVWGVAWWHHRPDTVPIACYTRSNQPITTPPTTQLVGETPREAEAGRLETDVPGTPLPKPIVDQGLDHRSSLPAEGGQ